GAAGAAAGAARAHRRGRRGGGQEAAGRAPALQRERHDHRRRERGLPQGPRGPVGGRADRPGGGLRDGHVHPVAGGRPAGATGQVRRGGRAGGAPPGGGRARRLTGLDRDRRREHTGTMIPSNWYNIVPDLPAPPPPPLHPATREPIGPDDLAPLFPMELIGQEVSQERFVPIPQEVLDVYRLWRPTPLMRARRLEKSLGTPARIYYKYEGVSPAGSHKPNTA